MSLTQKVVDEYMAHHSVGDFTSPVGAIPTSVVGRYGKLRHAGIFSPDNPHALQLQYATDNQDKDALYEKAINWEADRSNLLEQREYDDPVAQMARRRAAGENPDLIGGSGSGTSSGSTAVQPQTQSTISTSNKYQNLQNVFSGFQTASGFLSSIAGFGQMVGQLHSTLSLLPSQKKIADAEASVSEQTVNDRLAISGAAAKGAKLQTLNSSLDFVGKLAGWVAPGTSLEDAASIYNAAGIDPKEHDAIHSQVGAFHNNPKMKADYEDYQLQAKRNAAKNSSYTVKRMQNIMDFMSLTEEIAAQGNFYKESISSGIQEILASSNFAQNSALGLLGDSENSLVSNDTEAMSLDLRQQRLGFDIQAFGRQVEYIAKLKSLVDQEIIDFDPSKFPDSDSADAYYDQLLDKSMFLSAVGTEQFGELRRVFTSMSKAKYIAHSTHLGEDGGMLFYDSRAEYANVMFNDIATNPNLFKDFMNAGLGFVTGGLSDVYTQNAENNRLVYKLNYFTP